MTYFLIPAIIIAMLGYMFWSTIFRLRHDRVRTQRDQTRGKFAFRPRERMRFLLNRAFHVSDEKSEWESALVGSLAKMQAPDQGRHAGR